MLRLICLTLLSSSSAIFIYTFIPNAQLQQLKVVKLVLWNCGDIELNPGPPKQQCKSVVLRLFRRTAQTLFLLAINRAKGEQAAKPLYKEPPSWWNKRIPFVNICNEKTDKKSIECFQEIIDVLRSDGLAISNDLKQIATCYKNLLNNTGSKQFLDTCKEDLINWIDEQADQKTLTKVRDSKQPDKLVLSYLQHVEEQLNSEENKGTVSPEIIEMCRKIVEASRRREQVCHILVWHFHCSKCIGANILGCKICCWKCTYGCLLSFQTEQGDECNRKRKNETEVRSTLLK